MQMPVAATSRQISIAMGTVACEMASRFGIPDAASLAALGVGQAALRTYATDRLFVIAVANALKTAIAATADADAVPGTALDTLIATCEAPP